jgi:hypothetical protein
MAGSHYVVKDGNVLVELQKHPRLEKKSAIVFLSVIIEHFLKLSGSSSTIIWRPDFVYRAIHKYSALLRDFLR